MRTLILLLVLLPTTASAEPLRADVELDPTAYALSGNSIHVGIGHRHLRLDLGNFGLTVPEFVHGNAAFDVAFDGFGAKLQYFRRPDQLGWFAGVDGGFIRGQVRHRATQTTAVDLQLATGVNAGYRIALPAHFYVTPWIGVGYAWGTETVMLGGDRFQPTKVTVFPAIHVGYRFR